MQLHRIELWIEHKEILRKQPAVSDETAALAGDARVAVQEIRESADIAVGNERSRRRVRTQRRRSGNRSTVDDSRSGNIESPQHIVEQLRITPRAGGVKCIQKSVIENLHCVERRSVPKLRGFSPDITDAQGQVPRELPLKLHVVVLSIRDHAIVDGRGNG